MFHIGYDAKRAVANYTGLGNYSRLVIDLMSRNDSQPSHNLTLYAPKPGKENPRLQPLLNRKNVELKGPTGLWRKISGLWRLRGGITDDIIADGIDLFHGLSNELPLDIRRAGIPSIVTIHDVIFRRCPDNYKPVDRMIYDAKWRHAVKAATRIIAISQCTANDIEYFYGADPDKISIIYQGCDPLFHQPVTPQMIREVRLKYNLPERYIACVGTVEPRKNQLLAIRGLQQLPEDVKLVIAGRGRQPYASRVRRAISDLRLDDRVIWIEGVALPDLPALYAGARLSAYLSRYEGFGLPAIEALACGTPVIAATGSCLEEAAGKGGIYVDSDDVKGFADAANAILSDPGLRATLTTEGRQHIARFNHDNFAAQLERCYHDTIAQHRQNSGK